MDKEITAIAFVLWLQTWLKEDETIKDLTIEELLSLKRKWSKYWADSLSQPHFEDCTKIPCSCVRCCIEDLVKQAEKVHRVLNQDNDSAELTGLQQFLQDI